MITLLLALACATPDSTPTSAIVTNTDVDIGTSVDPDIATETNDCFEVGEGLTLFNLPRDELILVSVVGEFVYQESLVSDACGTATPFQGVEADDLDPEGFDMDEAPTVFALVVSDSSYYYFQGVFIDSLGELPISTQWEPVGAGEWVAVRDDEFGILIGPMMIP